MFASPHRGLWNSYDGGVTAPYSATATESFLRDAGVQVLAPHQYLDRWRLDRADVRVIENTSVKRARLQVVPGSPAVSAPRS